MSNWMEPPKYLYHGTAAWFLPAIQREGLKKMNRQYVHLSGVLQTTPGDFFFPDMILAMAGFSDTQELRGLPLLCWPPISALAFGIVMLRP